VYVINGVNISNVADQNFGARMRYGGAYLTADYQWSRINQEATITAASNGGDVRISELLFVDSNSASKGNIEIQIFNPSSVSTRNIIMAKGGITGSTTATWGQRITVARNMATTVLSSALTGIQILGQNGTNFSGTFRLYGIKNS
jgi:hypothetical protein